MFTKIARFTISFAFPMEYTMIPDYDTLADAIELTIKHYIR
jgi:hypothetical protein